MDSSKYSKVLLVAIFMGESSFNKKVDIFFSLDPVEQSLLTLGWLGSTSKGFKKSVDLIGE